MKEQRDLTDSSFYLVYVTSDALALLPVFRNRLQEVLQLRCGVTHFLGRGIDGTPGRDEHVQ